MFDALSEAEVEALLLSLRVALWATAASLPLGVLAAYALARWSFPGRQLLNGLVHLPLVLPPVVTGYILLLTFGTQGPVGGLLKDFFGVVLAFRWTGAVLAAAVMAFPLMVRAIRLSIEAVDPKLEDAAATLGASRVWTFLTVTLPLILPGVVAGAILAFAKAMGEFGATTTFVSNTPVLDAPGRNPGRGQCVSKGRHVSEIVLRQPTAPVDHDHHRERAFPFREPELAKLERILSVGQSMIGFRLRQVDNVRGGHESIFFNHRTSTRQKHRNKEKHHETSRRHPSTLTSPATALCTRHGPMFRPP